MKLSVYIIHASQDEDAVNALDRRLRENGFDPSPCCLTAAGGLEWREQAKKALEAADAVVFCISRYTMTREELFLGEFKEGLGIQENRDEEPLLILTLRLERCETPNRLKPFRAIDLFSDRGYESLVEALQDRMPTTARVVFSVHGIKTRGRWQKDVVPLLAQVGFTPVPLDYGHFLALQLLRRRSREKKIDWFRDEYIRQCDRLGCARPSIIAHSLGSYLVAEAMERYQQIKFDRVILCGSIVRRQFPWKEIAAAGQVRAVLNQYGGNDFWATVVEWVVPDAGQSGLRGFDHSNDCLIQQELVKFSHSTYFNDLNYRQTWIPFLQGKNAGPPPHDTIHVRNWRFLIAKMVLGLLLFVLTIFAYYWWRNNGSSASLRRLGTNESTPSVPPTSAPGGVNSTPPSQTSYGPQSPNVSGAGRDVTIQYGKAPAKTTGK